MSTDLDPTAAPNLTGELQLEFIEPLGRREVVVTRIDEISPRYRRVVFGGEDLASAFPFARFAPSDHVKVYFPDPETGALVSYRNIGTEEDEEWEVDGQGEPIRRDYTPRAWDPVSGELTLDFVLHDHGIAGRWAGTARAGDRLVVMGPRANWLLPQNYAHYVALGDETALPAISRILEEAPAHASVTALIEIADAAEEQPLGGGDDRRVHWIRRDSAVVADGDGSALETALKALALPPDTDGLYVFAAGETVAMKPIRRYLRREVGLRKRQVTVDGYWKRGIADFDHHESELDED